MHLAAATGDILHGGVSLLRHMKQNATRIGPQRTFAYYKYRPRSQLRLILYRLSIANIEQHAINIKEDENE